MPSSNSLCSRSFKSRAYNRNGDTFCGGVTAATQGNDFGLINHWIHSIREIASKHKKILKPLRADQTEYVNKLLELNVKEQVFNVCKTSVVQKAWSNKKLLIVHCWVVDLKDGLIRALSIDQKEWENMKEEFCYEFKLLKEKQ